MTSYASKKYKEIFTCDDEKEAKILRTPSSFLNEEEWGNAQSTVDRLLYVRNEVLKKGAGLAASQIGINHPIFIYTPDRTAENLRAVINPSFEPMGEESVEGVEACFSEPLRCATLKRWKKIKVRYQTLEKSWVEDVLEGFAAKVFQHEMDHLRGKLIVDDPDAKVMTFTDEEKFQAHMNQVFLEDSKTYTKK